MRDTRAFSLHKDTRVFSIRKDRRVFSLRKDTRVFSIHKAVGQHVREEAVEAHTLAPDGLAVHARHTRHPPGSRRTHAWVDPGYTRVLNPHCMAHACTQSTT